MNWGSAMSFALILPSPIGAAGAAPDAAMTRARLEVLAAPDCMTRADLEARVEARSPRIRFVDNAALSAQVTLDATRPGNVIAELVLATSDGKRSPRRVVARSCAEATDAVALIIAVTLDPLLVRKPAPGIVGDRSLAGDALAAPRAPRTEAAAGTSAAAEPEPAPGPQATARPAEQPAAARQRATPPAVELPAPSGPGPSVTTRRRFGVYVAGQTVFGPAPTVMPGVAIYVLAALDRAGPWSPAILVGATYVWRADLSEPGGKASFALDAASLDVCPLRLRLSLLEARACGSALVGLATASGADTDETASATRPFALAGGAVLVTAALGTVVELHARLGTGATLIRDAYEFNQLIFYHAGRVTTSASLGIGARWP